MMFLAELKKTFAHPVSEGSAMKWLLNLHQDHHSVVDIKTLAAVTGWPEYALKRVFLQALNNKMNDQLQLLKISLCHLKNLCPSCFA